MRVELRQITSADVEDLETYSPSPGTAWLVQADVTLAGENDPPGGDIFQFEVCSEEWIMERLREGPVFAGRLVIVRRFDYAAFWRSIEQKIAGIAAQSSSWEEFARAANWFMAWEFENYRDG